VVKIAFDDLLLGLWLLAHERHGASRAEWSKKYKLHLCDNDVTYSRSPPTWRRAAALASPGRVKQIACRTQLILNDRFSIQTQRFGCGFGALCVGALAFSSASRAEQFHARCEVVAMAVFPY
jgi:hypothetical protein